MVNEEILAIIVDEIHRIEKNWEKFPPQYCGAEEAAIQQREHDARIDALQNLMARFFVK